MKRFLKKALFGLAALLLLAGPLGALTGCGGGKEGVTVLLMANAAQDAFYKSYFSELSQKLDVEIRYEGVAFQDYYQRLKTDMQDVPPDIFYIRPGDIRKLAREGQLADFNSYFAGSGFTDVADLGKIYPHAVDMYRFDGSNVGTADPSAPIYGVNLGFSYQGLGYNKKIVNRKAAEINGAGLKLPWELGAGESYTFEQFGRILEIVADKTGGGYNGTDEISGVNAPNNAIVSLIWNYGGDVLTADGRTVTVDNEPVKKALAFVKNNLKKNAAGGDVIGKDASYPEWINGQLAFYTEVGSWEVGEYDAQGLDYDMMPWPSAGGDGNWYGQIGTSALAVSARSPKKDLALKIAAGFYTESATDRMVRAGISLPLVKDTAENGYLQDDETYKPANRKIFIDVVSGANGKYSPVNNTLNSEWLDDFIDNLDTVWNGTQDASAYAAAKQISMQNLLNASL
jgi:ABC-type glycerol-3-phosphate transport system substrate-binding protein